MKKNIHKSSICTTPNQCKTIISICNTLRATWNNYAQSRINRITRPENETRFNIFWVISGENCDSYISISNFNKLRSQSRQNSSNAMKEITKIHVVHSTVVIR